GGLRLSKLRQEQISSTVLNLKVSQVLLQQCNASLDPVESYLQTWEGHGGGASRIAVGPPSQWYCPPPHPLALELEGQLGACDKLQSQNQSQDGGSERDGDGAALVSRPAATGRTPGEHLANDKHIVCCWSTNRLPSIAELADLSSIPCSPARLRHTSLCGPPPPCNSTPRSLAYQKCDPTGAVGNNSLGLESPRVLLMSVPFHSEVFTTAVDISGEVTYTTEESGVCGVLGGVDGSGQQGGVEDVEQPSSATGQTPPAACGGAGAMNREAENEPSGDLHFEPVGGRHTEDPILLERTDRAHSSLDEVLQLIAVHPEAQVLYKAMGSSPP
ncbi:hypothetical protein CRUP_030536, partial [Coryphaenoides rupestris]